MYCISTHISNNIEKPFNFIMSNEETIARFVVVHLNLCNYVYLTNCKRVIAAGLPPVTDRYTIELSYS